MRSSKSNERSFRRDVSMMSAKKIILIPTRTASKVNRDLESIKPKGVHWRSRKKVGLFGGKEERRSFQFTG